VKKIQQLIGLLVITVVMLLSLPLFDLLLLVGEDGRIRCYNDSLIHFLEYFYLDVVDKDW
jgi:hypothetical protein